MRTKATNKKCATVKVAKKCECKCAAPKAVAPAKKCGRKAKKEVTFTVHAEKGKNIYLAGEFNEWDPTATKMSFKNGVYSAAVKLDAGTYQYKFVIDGTWCADPENAESVANDQGTFNSIVTVK